MYRALTADVPQSIVYTYPRLLPLARLADSPTSQLQPLRASVDKMNDQGVYLLGMYLPVLYCTNNISLHLQRTTQ